MKSFCLIICSFYFKCLSRIFFFKDVERPRMFQNFSVTSVQKNFYDQTRIPNDIFLLRSIRQRRCKVFPKNFGYATLQQGCCYLSLKIVSIHPHSILYCQPQASRKKFNRLSNEEITNFELSLVDSEEETFRPRTWRVSSSARLLSLHDKAVLSMMFFDVSDRLEFPI